MLNAVLSFMLQGHGGFVFVPVSSLPRTRRGLEAPRPRIHRKVMGIVRICDNSGTDRAGGQTTRPRSISRQPITRYQRRLPDGASSVSRKHRVGARTG
jgi:hypothetical protein